MASLDAGRRRAAEHLRRLPPTSQTRLMAVGLRLGGGASVKIVLGPAFSSAATAHRMIVASLDAGQHRAAESLRRLLGMPPMHMMMVGRRLCGNVSVKIAPGAVVSSTAAACRSRSLGLPRGPLGRWQAARQTNRSRPLGALVGSRLVSSAAAANGSRRLRRPRHPLSRWQAAKQTTRSRLLGALVGSRLVSRAAVSPEGSRFLRRPPRDPLSRRQAARQTTQTSLGALDGSHPIWTMHPAISCRTSTRMRS